MHDADDITMTDSHGKETGNVGKDTVVVDGEEIPYDKAFKKAHEDEDKTNDRPE